MNKALIYELGRSISFGRLPLLAKVLWPMLLAASDDQGRGLAEPDVIKWHVCPNVQEITTENIPELLKAMVEQGMIEDYQDSRGRLLYQVVRWWEYQKMQWAQPSQYDAPSGWNDRIRYRNNNEYQERNWKAETKPKPSPETQPDPSPESSLETPPETQPNPSPESSGEGTPDPSPESSGEGTNQTKLNQTKLNQTKLNQTKPTTTPTDKNQDASFVDVVGLLASFGIQETYLSEIANNGSDIATAQAWIWYAKSQKNLTSLTGFVVDRLLKHIDPPADLHNLACIVQQLYPEELEILRDRASERQRHGPKYTWWPLLFGEERNERLAELFDDWNTLELWYTHTYPDDDQTTEDIDPEFQAKRRAALAEWTERHEKAETPPGGDMVITGDLTASQVWTNALDELTLQMTEATFVTWLQDARLARYSDDTFTIQVKNEYAKDWLENRLRATIERTLTRLARQSIQICFEAG